MNKSTILLVTALAVLASSAIACGAPPTPTPTPVPPTPIPSSTPTRPATAVPTASRTFTPTPVTPTATAAPPTRTAVLDTPTRPPATARPRPPAPTGSIIFHSKADGVDRLFHVDPNTGGVTPFLDLGGGEMDLSIDDFGTNARIGEYSPDGTKFAYVFSGGPGKTNELRVYDVVNNKILNRLWGDKGISTPTWNADGSRIAFIRRTTNDAFIITIVDSKGGKIDDKPFLEVKPDDLASAQFRGGISWAKSNLMVVAANIGGASDIFTFFPDTDKSPIVKNLTNNPAEDTTPVFNRDGTKIAFTSTRDGRPQIYVMNADGSGLARVSNGQADDTSPTWSPDGGGNWITFVSNRDGGGNVYMMDAFGGNIKRLTNGDHPAWSH